MNFPSIHSMLYGIGVSFKRYTPAIILAVIGVTAALMLTYREFYNSEYLYRVIMCATLGLPLFIAIRLYCEKSETSSTVLIIYYSIALALLVAYFFTLPGKPALVPMVRFSLLLIGMHLLVSFSPFTSKNEFNGFWQFNKTLFLRFLTSALFSVVLFAGLSLAILAIDILFAAHIDGRIYFRLWIVIAGLFNTWFFLSGIPGNIKELQHIVAFPKGLKIFTQYILIPLVSIYMVILYAYSIKILITWNFPNGWVSYLVLFFSGAGIFSLLLIYPAREMEGNNWIKMVSKWFYIVLVPMLVLLAIAIWKRIDEYGVTENRYFIIALNIWLALISLYFIISKTKSIKIIPITLCILAFITSFGPWGAFSISHNSQFRQLEKTLTEAKVLVNGKLHKAPDNITYAQKHKIVSIVNYLDRSDALELMKPWISQNMDSLFSKDASGWVDKQGKILNLMGIDKWDNDYNYQEPAKDDSMRFNYFAPVLNVYNVKDYDYYFSFTKYAYYRNADSESPEEIKRDVSFYTLEKGDSLGVYFNRKNMSLDIVRNERHLISIDITAVQNKINAFLKVYSANGQHDTFSPEIMMLTNENDAIKISIYFSEIGGFKGKNKISKINNLNAAILVKLKDVRKKQTK